MPAPDATVLLEHVRRASSTVLGPATGRVYVFTQAEPVQAVHPGDVPPLIASGLFQPAVPVTAP